MPITHSRKAINFDLDDNLLKQNYPSKSYKNAWRDIKIFLLESNFIHRQYSGFVSKTGISMADVGNILEEMSTKMNCLGKVVKEFDVTIVGDEYSFVSRMKNSIEC